MIAAEMQMAKKKASVAKRASARKTAAKVGTAKTSVRRASAGGTGGAGAGAAAGDGESAEAEGAADAPAPDSTAVPAGDDGDTAAAPSSGTTTKSSAARTRRTKKASPAAEAGADRAGDQGGNGEPAPPVLAGSPIVAGSRCSRRWRDTARPDPPHRARRDTTSLSRRAGAGKNNRPEDELRQEDLAKGGHS